VPTAGLTLPLAGTDFRVEPNWGNAPADVELTRISAVAVTSDDRVVVFQRSEPPVAILDADGSFVSGWGADLVDDPHGIFVDAEDHVYLVDRDGHAVVKCTLDGDLLLRIGSGTPAHGKPFSHPTDVAVSPQSGDIFVSDGYGNAMVHRFAPDGELICSWGKAGNADGEFNIPHGIWVDRRDRVLVADRENDRIQAFTTDGDFITAWYGFHRPTDIFIDSSDVVFVSDLSTRVHALTLDGEHLGCGRSTAQCHALYGSSTGDLYLTWPLPNRRLERWSRR
jgi:DNA-binding beta-propeller fold protein YncE